jgi:hypothetical protein
MQPKRKGITMNADSFKEGVEAFRNSTLDSGVSVRPRKEDEACKELNRLGYRWDGYRWNKPFEVG